MEHPVSDNSLPPLRENVLLAPYTTFDIGGPARYHMQAADRGQLAAALRFAHHRRLRWYVLGGGSNVLVSDAGFDGLVIVMGADGVEVSEEVITAEAGASLMSVVNNATAWGLGGMEPLAGIPGTIGGAVRGNAGAFGAAIGDMVKDVAVMDGTTLQCHSFSRDECLFAYRSSVFKTRGDLIILALQLKLTRASRATISRGVEETLQKRSGLQHAEKCAGSFFLNPEGVPQEIVRQFEEEKKISCRNCRIPAGWLIERSGLRGARVGGAMVSELHANYIINTGSATADDVGRLARHIRQQVRERLGVDLQEEVTSIGF